MRTSLVCHMLNGLINLVGTIVLIYSFTNIKLNYYQIGIGLLILSISWGIHCVLHFYEEYMYNFDPLNRLIK